MTEPVKRGTRSRVNGVLPKPKEDIEVGVSAYLPFVTPYKNVWEALRYDELTVKQLIAMRKTDGQARALYRLITLPIRAALKTATFVPENHVDGGEEEAAFIEQMFTLPSNAGGMTVPFQRFISQMLMAVFEGFAAFELVYWSPKTGPLKGKWTLKKAAHRPAETLTFLVDDNSEFAGLRQRCMYQGREIDETLPPEHTVYWAANEEERPFYGQSYFQAAWYHWDKKFKLYTIAHIAAQRAAVGTRIGKLPSNPQREEKAAFAKALADLGVAQYMTIPDNYSVESLKESSGFDFLAYINHHNSQMSKSVLAAFFDKEQGGGDAGKLVDFGTQSDALFMLMLQTIMSEIEEVINQQIIPRFIDWNFDSGKYPQFQFGSLSQEQKSAILDLFKVLAVGGQSLTVRPEFVHELEKQVAEEFGLEIDWETVEEQMEEEKELARQQQEMQMMGDPAAGGTPAVGDSPVVDPSLLPPGFTLSNPDAAYVALTDLANDLLDEAYQTVELVRGKTISGQPKIVRTQEGSRVYGVPIGTPITRDMENRAGDHGIKGKPYGAGKIKDPHGKNERETLGGGPGAKPQDPGNVASKPTVTGASAVVKRTFSHPKQPGVQLLDYGDGTVAIKDDKGNISRRQRFSIEAFRKLGWKVDGAYDDKPDPDDKPEDASESTKGSRKPKR